ncbi:unnamed protein product, partial [Oppiella nova]
MPAQYGRANALMDWTMPKGNGIQEYSGVCYGELGCFNRTDNYKHPIFRPTILLPQSPQRINTKLILYERSQPDGRVVIVNQWIVGKDLTPFLNQTSGERKDIKFIITGFKDNPSEQQWINRLKNELLINGDYIVFVVDWSGGNGLPYHQAIENMRVVVTQLSIFMTHLQSHLQVPCNNYHLIGYSLGAHLAGLLGKQLQNFNVTCKLGRISGMEPARPYFEHLPQSRRLSRSDANFVDIIHTESRTKGLFEWGAGMSQAIGHVDFYPNGGSGQPGCSRHRISRFWNNGWTEG